MRETDLLHYIQRRSRDLAERFEHVLVGPGHDCAVIAPAPPGARASSVLLKTDQLLEGRHFTSQTPLHLIARKALARPLSDIAAAAGAPRCALVAATLPSGYPLAKQLVDCVHDAGLEFACPVVGGDLATASPNHPVHLTVSILGTPHPHRGPVLRSGACPGDFIYVTGSLGGSFCAHETPEHPFPGGGKHLTFQPRLAEADWLATALGEGLHAMMDISDGLGRDAARLAEASNVCIELDAASIPLSAGIPDPLRALSDGEDYELLFASPRAPMAATCGNTGTPIHLIGTVHARAPAAPACLVRMPDGTVLDASEFGWDHT